MSVDYFKDLVAMRFLYSMLMYLLTPYLLLRLWWKSRRLSAYRMRIAERFGFGIHECPPVDVWVHAVSLGEMIAASPLIDSLLTKHYSVLVTTMTPTGSEQALMRFGNRVSHQYIPYDIPCALKRFLKHRNPGVGIIMETELWPNLIYQAAKAKVPLLLANARLSERSHRGYMMLRFFFKPLLQQFWAILTQSEDDARRFIALGAQSTSVRFLGNIKFDIHSEAVDSQISKSLKELWGAKRPVVIAASTHEGEEVQILNELRSLQQAIPNVILLIAPRHPERFQTVLKLCKQTGFNTGLRSETHTLCTENEVIVLDCLGELMSWYQISDYAFVGGSFVPVGGHNVLEPIAVGVPVLSGTQVHNFKAICAELKAADAIQLIADAKALTESIIKLHQDHISRQQMIDNASGVLEQNKGSVAKHLDQIELALASRSN